ncbi:major facilitator superfamily domain-containing protein [Colletotrichum acutatum]|uniref:Major facilitator superfamily domain-containing protein n=1 Tax=Glomerella acutata TaxID=27357 RepID=A0AAD8UB74_GLOAC|nr:major facilitator superfamily domain-containing protein [Colletotrichum acutatum]KAK1705322.1 major facilitator superfamily domain-containing protein [Colletotrichum acutatum]
MDTEKGTYPERQVVPSQDGHDTDHSSDDHAAGSAPKAEEQTYDDRKAWVTVAASSLTMFVYLGVIYSWGILQVKLVETTGSSLTTLTFVGSMATSFMICFSIVSDKIISRIGYRLAALIGGLFMGLGEVLASFTTHHVVALFFLHGLVFGLGGGLCIFVSATRLLLGLQMSYVPLAQAMTTNIISYQSVSTAPMGLFKKHKALAMGFVFGGGSLGSAIMSVVANYLVKDLGVSWTFRILGFVLWGVSIPASYFLPRRITSGKKPSRQLQWYRFKEPRFLLLVGGTVLSCFPLFIPPYFIPIFSRSMGYTKEIGIIILACWNLASTLGRVVAGWVADTFLGPVESLAICMLFMALSSLIVWPLSSSIGIFSVYLIFNGIGCGAFFSLTPIAVSATFGGENTLSIIPVVWTTWFCGFFFVSHSMP